MSKGNNSVGRILVFMFLGLIFGGIFGETLGWLLGHIGTLMNAGGENNLVRNFFIKAWEFKVGYAEDGNPLFIDLYMLQFNIAFTIKMNIVSVVGLIVSMYIMKWSGSR